MTEYMTFEKATLVYAEEIGTPGASARYQANMLKALSDRELANKLAAEERQRNLLALNDARVDDRLRELGLLPFAGSVDVS